MQFSSQHEMENNPTCFLNACYGSYYEQFIHTYVSQTNKQINNQNAISGHSGKNARLLQSIPLKAVPETHLLLYFFMFKCNLHIQKSNSNGKLKIILPSDNELGSV